MADAEPSHPNQPQVATEFPGTIKINTDGTIHRLRDTDFVPPSSSSSGVSSKDVLFHPDSNLSARLHLPPSTDHRKLPLVLYFHGGGFCISSPFCSKYNRYASRIAAESQSLVVSFDYRKAPEHPIPAAYEDSWAGLLWAASHQTGNGPEPWLNEHADFGRIFLAGDSAGGNIVHNLAMAAGNPEFGLEMEILGAALVHPYFSKEGVKKLWGFICPSSPDNDDPRVNPVAEDGPGLVGLGCRRVLVCVAEKDVLRDRGWMYYEALGRSGWMGVVEISESEGEGHAFHLYDLEGENADTLIKRLAAFFNRDIPLLSCWS
ncbi:Probable carboxylesterase 13 [Linum grandiflorum]